VECWGGGGAGGAAKASSGSGLAGGGGGGGGAYAINTAIGVTPGHNYNVVVGAGGTSSGGTSTGGGASSFTGDITTVSANGGTNGTSESPSSGNAFGAGGSGGATNALGLSYAGGSGATAVTGVGGGGGGSSASAAGVGSNGGASPATATTGGGTLLGGGTGGSGSSSSADGGAGYFPGGGGAGAYSKSTTQRNGGAGGGGQVVITVAAAFTFAPGNLAVLQPADASANNTTLIILELSTNAPAQAFAYSVAIEGTDTNGLRFSGSAGTSGYLADSGDGSLLALAGATSTNATLAVNSIVARGVGTLSPAAQYVLQTTYTASSTPTQPRGASTIDDVNWVIGDQGGIYTNSASAASPAGNFKAVKSFGGTNFVLTATAGVPAVMAFSGGATNYLPGVAADANATDFYLVSSGSNGAAFDLLYVIDNTSATVGSVYKYSLAGGTWTANGTYSTGLGGYGLCAATNGAGGVILYFTTGSSTTGNSVVQVTDTGGWNAPINVAPLSGVTLYTAGAGALLKGLAFTPTAIAPMVLTSGATSAGTTNATLNGTVSYDGGAPLTSYGFYWSTTPPVTTNSTKIQVGAADFSGAYSTNLSGLSANTCCYYRAYANNSAGNSIGGSDVSFYTLANTPTAPTVGTPTTNTLEVAIGAGDGNPAATTYAIQETTAGEFVQANGTLGAAAVFQTASAWGTTIVTNLGPDTAYSFAVEAQNGAKVATAFGPSASGATTIPASPTISVMPNLLSFPPTLVNGTSANQSYAVSGTNLSADITITAPSAFQVSTSSDSGFGTSVVLTQSGGTVAATTIYVRFQPTAQTGFSGNISNASSGANDPTVGVSGVGANAPSVTTQIANPTNSTSATLNGTVTATNGAAILDRGFYWSSLPNVNAATGTQLSEGGTTPGAFSKALSGLTANTAYYYRAYASNSVGFMLGGADVGFYTLANTPTAPNVTGATTNTLKVAVGIGDGNPGSTLYAIYVTKFNEYVQSNGSLNTTPAWQTTNAWAAATVTGLNLGTAYAFAVMAENNPGIPTALGPATPANTANGPFTLGNLAVLCADDAATNNTTFSIVELNRTNVSETAVQTFPINGTSGAGALRVSGSAGSAPKLADSGDGTLLVFAGFNSTNGSVTANSITNRAVGTLDVFGDFTLQTTYVGISGNQVRNAATTDNHTWYIGDAGGIYTNGSTSPLNTSNIDCIKSFGGMVYVLQSAKGTVPVSTLSANGTTLTGLPGMTNRDSAAVDFYLVSSGANGPIYDILYVLDETSATSGAVNKYYLSGGTWALNGTNATVFGGYGLAACLNGAGGVDLYITSGDGTVAGNAVYQLTDASAWNAALNVSAQNLIYTATGAATLKGIAFAPLAAVGISRIVAGNPTRLTATGFPYASYVMERSTNLMQWVSIQTNSAAGNGVLTVTDAFGDLGLKAPPAAFYRVAW
jgi:hypothetical protein